MNIIWASMFKFTSYHGELIVSGPLQFNIYNFMVVNIHEFAVDETNDAVGMLYS